MGIYYSKHISWQLIEETIYIVDENTCKIYSLKNVAKDIWLAIRDISSVNEIMDVVSERYNISKDIFISDMNDFIKSLISTNLLIQGGCYGE